MNMHRYSTYRLGQSATAFFFGASELVIGGFTVDCNDNPPYTSSPTATHVGFGCDETRFQEQDHHSLHPKTGSHGASHLAAAEHLLLCPGLVPAEDRGSTRRSSDLFEMFGLRHKTYGSRMSCGFRKRWGLESPQNALLPIFDVAVFSVFAENRKWFAKQDSDISVNA
ncbi:hypothetical protein BC826DRAFT_1001482 [Russula brevipes]|nr:hypothetical protein BC826DRAFT_1001482 [Russula brevipes]